jgi:hypothetical protein
MKTIIAKVQSASPYSQSKAITSKRNTGENHDAFEERTWRERMHVDKVGNVFIPPQAIKNCLSDVARFLGETVPGKGKSTYTKHFDAGIMVTEPAILPIKAEKVDSLRLFVPSDGKKGGGTRVWKNFPVIQEWAADFQIILLDPMLIDKPEKVVEYLSHAGKFIGLGYFRPRNGGYFGRFKVVEHTIIDGVE